MERYSFELSGFLCTILESRNNLLKLKYYLHRLFNTDYFHKYVAGFTNGTNILGLIFSGIEKYRLEIPVDKILKWKKQESKTTTELACVEVIGYNKKDFEKKFRMRADNIIGNKAEWYRGRNLM